MSNVAYLAEQRRLMGLAPRFQYEAVDGEGLPDSDTPHPDSPEGDQDAPETPKPDPSEPPGTTGSSQHWDLYRELEEEAMKLAKANIAMQERMSQMTEGELSREQKRYLKNAQAAVGQAVSAQKEAYRKIAEFGSTMLG